MVITYQGAQSFKVQFGETVLAFNPISKDSKLKSTKFGANIVLVSLNHEDFNGVENATFGEKSPFVITGPGEYEVGGIIIKGYLSESHYDGEEKFNTIYYVNFEGMNICFLGALDNEKLSTEALEGLDNVDILFVPIGGSGVLDAHTAYKLAVKLEAGIIIPMSYGVEAENNSLQTFIKEGGVQSVPPVEKLVIKKKDLEGRDGEIVVLKSSN